MEAELYQVTYCLAHVMPSCCLLCCSILQQYAWLTTARASSLQSGCAAILAIMKLLKVQDVLVSDRDLLHGLMMDMVLSNDVVPAPCDQDARP
jgi:hypothetical protein